MSTYHKIQTLWHRDPATNHKTLLEGHWSEPEFAMLAGAQIWQATEKIDGTNIRIYWDGHMPRIAGRTDSAQVPTFLYDAINAALPMTKLLSVFGDKGGLVLYGEGCGSKIQKAGEMYGKPHFVLFDIAAGDTWFSREQVKEAATALGVSAVPTAEEIQTLWEWVDAVKLLPQSTHGSGPAEGFVLRPYEELKNRLGQRIITKIKAKDFR